nr:Hypothetical protein [Raoultella ornithinolytica]
MNQKSICAISFALHYHLPTSYTAVVVGLRRNRRKIRHSCRRDGLDFENYCTIRASPACQRRCLWFLSALQ